jgi:hypothetical protein
MSRTFGDITRTFKNAKRTEEAVAMNAEENRGEIKTIKQTTSFSTPRRLRCFHFLRWLKKKWMMAASFFIDLNLFSFLLGNLRLMNLIENYLQQIQADTSSFLPASSTGGKSSLKKSSNKLDFSYDRQVVPIILYYRLFS